MDISGGVMVSKLNYQTFTSEFEFHLVPYSLGLVQHRSGKLRKLLFRVQGQGEEGACPRNLLETEVGGHRGRESVRKEKQTVQDENVSLLLDAEGIGP